MPEISDAELHHLRQAAAGYEAVNRLWNDPNKGMAFKRALKTIVPDAPIPDLDMIESVRQETDTRLGEVMKQIKELRDGQEHSRVETEVSTKLDAAATEFNLTRSGRDKLRQFMVDTQTPDPMIAAAAMVRNEPALTGVEAGSADYNPLDFSKMEGEAKEMFDDPLAWANKTFQKAFSAPRR